MSEKDLPPSYNEATTSSSPQLSTTLSSLTTLLRTTQAQQSALDTLATTNLLPLLTPHLTALLTRLGTTPHPPALAELVFVPAAAVDREWTIASDTDKKAGEVVQVVRISKDTKTTGDSKSATSSSSHYDSLPSDGPSGSYEFNDWGRWDDDVSSAATPSGEEWWWNDEALARRLAKRLQPEPDLDRTTVRAVVEQAKEEKKASRWGLFRGPSQASSSLPSPTPHFAPAPAKQQEDVNMTVRAEEVTFRKENEMGIWESTRGWGIVARVRIRR